MNLMHIAVSSNMISNDDKINKKLLGIREQIKKDKIKISEKYIKMGTCFYYQNVLPFVPEMRDVLKKPTTICLMRVNWKKQPFEGLTAIQICDQNLLKEQYGWCVQTVDAEHTRNNYKNREIFWVIFDTEEAAIKNRYVFNMMFRTAIEQDAIDEYKKFKQNPLKRPLTFDKLVENAYELYDLVDKGED